MAVHRSALATRYSSPMERVAKSSETKCSATNDAQPVSREGRRKSAAPLTFTFLGINDENTYYQCAPKTSIFRRQTECTNG